MLLDNIVNSYFLSDSILNIHMSEGGLIIILQDCVLNSAIILSVF